MNRNNPQKFSILTQTLYFYQLRSQFISGSAAGLAQTVIATPVELVKIREQMNPQKYGKMGHNEGKC